LVVAAEMIGGSAQGGIGYLLISSGQVMQTEKVFASLVVLAVVGAMIIKLQQWADHKIAPWMFQSWRGGRKMRNFSLVIACVLALATLAGQGRAADVVRVGDGPFITGGGYFIAREKGYFQKLGIEIQPREFQDGSMSVPAMIAGELEFSGMT